MSLPGLSIKRPVFAWMLMFALMLFGWLSFKGMGISELPDVDFPIVTIDLALPNATPEIMENDVIDPMEDAVMGIEGIKNVRSSATQGAATIVLEFEINRNIDVAIQEVQTRVSQAIKKLPANMSPPVVSKTNPEDQPILWLMLQTHDKSKAGNQFLMNYARNILKSKFSTISGVGSINFAGYVDPSFRVWLDPIKLKKFSLTPDDVIAAITSEQIEEPAGRVENSKNETNIRFMGEARTPSEFLQIPINNRSGSPNYAPVFIRDVATVEEGLAEIRSISRLNGEPAVGLGIVKQRGANAVSVAKLIKERIAELQKKNELPKDITLSLKFDSTKFIKESVDELTFTLILSGVLTSVVCFVFLGSINSTVNVLFSIPTSILGAFIFLKFWGFTLNTFTLLGLSLAIGIVVDDAIMMLENIVRHFDMGKTKVKAALEGAEEISFAAIAATVAIAAIFIPVIFMKGIIGKFFYQFGMTVTVAVFLSLLEALTLTPMRCAEMGGSLSHHGSFIDSFLDTLTKFYSRSLAFALRFKYIVLIASLILFGFSIFSVTKIRSELLPPQDTGRFILYIKAPVSYSITATDQEVKKAELMIKQIGEIEDIYSTIGGVDGQDLVNVSSIYITLKEAKQRKKNQFEIMKEVAHLIQKNLPEMEVYTRDIANSSFSASKGYPIEFTIQGRNQETIADAYKKIKLQLIEEKLVTDINSDYLGLVEEIKILPERTQAFNRGVSMQNISNSLSTMIGGTIFNSSTQYPKEGHRFDIKVQGREDFYNDEKNIHKVLVKNNRGANTDLISISELTQVKKSMVQPSINRLNREKSIPVYANVKDGVSQAYALERIEAIAKSILPENVHLTISGSAATFRESFSSLVFALILGIIVAYMILAAQFNSFIHPIAVLLALPFSLTGAFLTLLYTNNSFNLYSMIGLILLMGIVKKNSILLVDFTNEKRNQGLSAEEALLAACPVRLRPILMTTIACIAGVVPAAISLGPGAETRSPMAWAIIGGVSFSTILTLIVVPCAYSILTPLEKKHEST